MLACAVLQEGNTMNRTEMRRTTGISSNPSPLGNLWLAVGDETGQFEKNSDSSNHGVALVLAKAVDWAGIANEQIDGYSVQYRFSRPVEGLAPHLISLFPAADKLRKEESRHHVMAAFRYFESQKHLVGGTFGLSDAPDDPVLRSLLVSMRWLAGHDKLLGVGVYGPGLDLYQRLYQGDDPMAALGALYGHLLAAVFPFLGRSPRLRVLLSGRTENAATAGVERVKQQSSRAERLPSHQTGGDRINIAFTEDSFWQVLSGLEKDADIPQGVKNRREALAIHANSAAFKPQLAGQGINLPDVELMKNLADLACGMMATLAPESQGKKFRFALGKQPGPNVRFFSIRELMA
jgi:hypothetical protein